jgi:type VI protein secretion system component VasK
MDGIDAILSATGLLIFTAMTYLLTVDDVKNALIPRLIALALNVPLAITVWAILRYGQTDAPDLEDLDEGLRENREGSFEAARTAMVAAFVANRRGIEAKKRLRAWSTLLAAFLFVADLLGFVVHWVAR